MRENIHSDVAVVGGGVMGASVSYWLSKKGFDTVLIEQSLPSSGASGACDGFIFLQSKKDPQLVRLASESIGIFKDIKDDLPLDIEFEECGGMVLFKDEDSLRSFLDTCPVRDSLKVLDDIRIKEYETEVSSEIAFATFHPGECQVNPINLNLALLKAAGEKGLRVYKKTAARGFSHKDGRIEGIITDNDIFIKAGQIVLCTGAWTGKVGQVLGLKIPVIPRKGMIAVTEVMPERIGHVILDYDYICCKFDEDRESGFSIEQTLNGNILIGSTRQFCGFDTSVDIEKLSAPLRDAASIFPFLESVNIIRAFAGLRPFSGTGLPIIGPSQSYENLFIAAGHEGDGIALSPVSGKIIADMIEERTSGRKVSQRFGKTDITNLMPDGF